VVIEEFGMKKMILVAVFIDLAFIIPLMVFAGEISVQKASENEWKLYDQAGDFIGTLKRIRNGTDKGTYRLYNKRGRYAGQIFKSGNWKPQRRHHPRITPEAAQLYLDALKAIQEIEVLRE
jgi:hypothetical protein